MLTTPDATLALPLAEVHSQTSGRIDARKIATFLDVPLPRLAASLGARHAAVHKTPDAPSLQQGLGPIQRSLALVSQGTRNRLEARIWLNSPHPDLGEKTPLEVILSGRADAVVTLLENAMAGLPS